MTDSIALIEIFSSRNDMVKPETNQDAVGSLY